MLISPGGHGDRSICLESSTPHIKELKMHTLCALKVLPPDVFTLAHVFTRRHMHAHIYHGEVCTENNFKSTSRTSIGNSIINPGTVSHLMQWENQQTRTTKPTQKNLT